MRTLISLLLFLPLLHQAQNRSTSTGTGLHPEPIKKNETRKNNWNETSGNSFNAMPNQGKVLVYWSTGSEKNNAGFTIERSSDGVNFTTLSEVHAAGNTQQITDYREVDYQPYAGTSYYRIKQKNTKGEITVSDAITVKNYYKANSGSDGGPSKMAWLNNENPNKKETLVLMMDASGNEQVSKVIITKQDHHLYAVDPESKCLPGTYLVLASSNNKLYSQKLIINE